MSQNKNRYAVHCTDESGNYAIDDQQEQVTLFATTAVDRLNTLTAERDRLKANDKEGANTVMDLMKQLETARFELEVLKVERDELRARIDRLETTARERRDRMYNDYSNDLNGCRLVLRKEQEEVKRLKAEVLELKHLLHFANTDPAQPLHPVIKERDEAVALLREFYRMARAEHEADLWVRVQRFFKDHPPQVVVVDEKGIQR